MATYTIAATGPWSAGATWVGGVKPPSGAGHKIVIPAGRTVTYDEAAGTYGDDTSSTTAANNAIVVNGTLKFSRSTSTQLTCRGTLFVATNGTLDAGSTADPIPAGVTCTIVLNDSATLAVGKHVMTSQNQTGVTWRINGKPRTRNTGLTSAISAGATSITVDASVGWEIGDQIVIASEDANSANSQVVTISGGSSPTWTVPAITVARSAGCKIGNFSSNVTVKPSNTTYPTGINFGCSATGTLTIDVHDVRFESIGSPSGWVTSGQPSYYGVGITAGASAVGSVSMSSCALYHGVAVSISAQFVTDLLSTNLHEVSDFAFYNNGSYTASYAAQNSRIKASNFHVYRSNTVLASAYGAGGLGWVLDNPTAWSSGAVVSLTGGALTINGGILRSPGQLCSGLTGSLDVYNANINAAAITLPPAASAIAKVGLYGCTFGGSTLTGNMTTGNVPSQIQRSAIVRVDGVESDNRDYSYWRLCSTDATTRKRSTYAVKLQPKVANTAITYTFTLPAVSGVAQTIKGSLRFDATYGTATPPSIALSGQGVTASFTAPATADAWHDFTLSFTPTSTGDITATVTVQSTSTSGFAWLDGVYHYPMTQSVRHYGYQWLPKAAQDVDTRITLTEAAALALPIVVDHGAETITITGSATAREVFEHCIADLCQTGNQGEAVHISSATGATFATTYTVVGDVVGVYTDATGASASLTLAGLQDASVLLVDGSGATVEFQAAQSGEFDYVYNFAPGATGTWRWVAKAPGREHATGTFTPGAGGAFSYAPVLTQKLTPSGDPMYTGTTSALVSVSIPGTTNAYIDIGDGTAPLQESFNETELALVTQAGLEWLAAGKDDVSVFDSGSGDYLFLTAGWRLRRASAGDANAAIEAYVTSADGGIVDDTNGPVLYLTSNTPAAIAAAVWAYIDRELTQAIPTAAQIADTMLGRNLAGGSDGGRTVRDALRASRNKSAISGSTLTIYQEDDATPAWTAAVSTAERDALQSIDPA